MMRRCICAFAVLAIGVWAVPAFGQQQLFKNTETGNPNLKSIEAITFAPNGLLLIGDGKGRQVVAIDTGDVTPQKWQTANIANIDQKIAMRLGTKANNIEILKMAVNPASQRAYVAVRHLGEKTDLLVTVDGKGNISEFPLDKVKFVRVALPEQGKVSLITDITWAKDRVLVAAQANDTFRSKLFSIAAPLAGGGEACNVYSTETYHVAHRRWETRAPMYTIIPYTEKGKRYVVGAFTCTPIVKYSLDSLESGAKVKGQSVIEVGSGNRPTDMFVYSKGGKKYILMSVNRFHHARRPVGPSRFWTVRVEYDLLKETANVNKKALWRVDGQYKSITDRAIVVPTFHYVTHMDQLDANRALVVRTGEKGGFSLSALALP